jgi:hypothetical protein
MSWFITSITRSKAKSYAQGGDTNFILYEDFDSPKVAGADVTVGLPAPNGFWASQTDDYVSLYSNRKTTTDIQKANYMSFPNRRIIFFIIPDGIFGVASSPSKSKTGSVANNDYKNRSGSKNIPLHNGASMPKDLHPGSSAGYSMIPGESTAPGNSSMFQAFLAGLVALAISGKDRA